MRDVDGEVTRVTGEFLSRVAQLSRVAAGSMVASAFGGPSVSRSLVPTLQYSGVGAMRRIGPRATVAAVMSTAGRRQANGNRPRRGPDDMARTSARFVRFVSANPGLRIEQINRKMGSTTGDLALPIRKLVASGEIVTRGKKRSTTYFVRGRSPAGARASRVKAK